MNTKGKGEREKAKSKVMIGIAMASLMLAAFVTLTVSPALALSWHIETIDSVGDVGWYTSIALDSSGYPHISYFDYSNKDLKYAYYDGSSWRNQTIDSAGSVGRDTSIALDSSGYPHISYFDYTNRDLKYAYYDGSSWRNQTIDSAGSVGAHSSIALDSSGYPHISYYDWPREGHPATVGFCGYPHISYYDWYPNGDLKYAHANHPPVANAGPDQTVEQDSLGGAKVTLNGTGSYDPDGDLLTYNWTWNGGSATGVSPTVSLPLGTTTVTLTVSDGELTDTDTVDITVQDTTPPGIGVTVSPNTLWPPNHKMVNITATVEVSDICDAAPTVVLTNVTSNEPDDAKGKPWDSQDPTLGDGNTVNDIQEADLGTEDYEFQLRAERSGTGDGRVYTITYTATDASGNSATAEATVVVPRDMEK